MVIQYNYKIDVENKRIISPIDLLSTLVNGINMDKLNEMIKILMIMR